MLRCLALRERWNRGDYTWDGDQVISGGGGGSQKYRSKCAYLEQNPSLFPEKTALKNVLIGQAGQTPLLRRLTGMVRSDDYMGAMDELEKFGLLDKAHVKAGKLSGGERQRVAICRALVHGAGFIAADEPAVGLDPKSAERVLNTLKALARSRAKSSWRRCRWTWRNASAPVSGAYAMESLKSTFPEEGCCRKRKG
ncbi:hypothetical protein HMSSN036_16040 [Paenibacillus macerans]|nr:hypothetical protein HMSSN036_16040 [Paenibacillus macerans]